MKAPKLNFNGPFGEWLFLWYKLMENMFFCWQFWVDKTPVASRTPGSSLSRGELTKKIKNRAERIYFFLKQLLRNDARRLRDCWAVKIYHSREPPAKLVSQRFQQIALKRGFSKNNEYLFYFAGWIHCATTALDAWEFRRSGEFFT